MNATVQSNISSFAGTIKQVEHLDVNEDLAMRMGVVDFSHELAVGIKQQFEDAGHNINGWTLGTLLVNLNGAKATVQMGGGAFYVEYGTQPHLIEGAPLHWDEDAFATSVWHPGITADPFIERSMDAIDYEKILTLMAVKVLSPISGVVSTSLEEDGSSVSDSAISDALS